MIEKTATAVPTLKPNTVGRVVFVPGAGQKFFFFVPEKIDKSIKILDKSMWSEKSTPDYEICWRANTCLEALCWLRDNMGKISLSPEVARWLRNSTSVNPIEPIPNLPLYDFQLEGAGFLRDRDRAMLSLSPGLGKTITSIVAACELPEVEKILVIAPASLLFMWKAELEKWEKSLNANFFISIWNGKWIYRHPKLVINNQFWTIVNPESLPKTISMSEVKNADLMILDESILYKGRNSKRTKNVLNLGKYIPKVWELTGAPATRMVDDMWSQFHILNPKAYGSYWRFAQNYCIVDNTPWANVVAANKLNSEEAIKERFKDIYFARSQEEVLNIPDWLFTDLDIPMTTQQEKHYRDLEIWLWSEFKDEEDNTRVVTVDNHLAKVVRLIQSASNPMLLDGKDTSGKWEVLPELLPMYDPPYIIWTSFIRSAKALAVKMATLGLRTACMIGETPPQERQTIVDNFQAKKIDCLVLGQAVGSFGLTLTAGRTAFYPERNYDGSYFQSLYRIRRIGTTHSPNIVHMRSVYGDGTRTIDHLVHSMLDYRVGMVQKLTVGMVLDSLNEDRISKR